MSRPSRIITASLFALTAFTLVGCKTIYTDTYAWKRNHFVPIKEAPKDKDLLPSSLPSPAPSSDAALPPPAPAPAPAMDAAPAPMAPM